MVPPRRPLAYIAGPLFDDGERWWIERLEQLVAGSGIDTFLPHRDNPDKDASNTRFIFDNDRSAIDRADVIVASLNGVTTDDGTAWELGYAYARRKYIIGIHTDWRRRYDHETVNLMIEFSLDVLARSLDEATDALRSWLAAHAAG
jgi:nucleoside 2-deoxyribosyltransferase